MKDAKNNEMYEGWYWFTAAEETDIFYPCYYFNGKVKIESKWLPTTILQALDFYRAEMPV